jgi:Uma2 family endonuclease
MPPPGFYHGKITINVSEPLKAYVKANNLGVVLAEAGFELAPDTVRAPDVAFIRRERFEAVGNIPGYWPGAPDLAIEIISPGDLYTDVDEKVREWLNAGARMVVVVNPRNRTVTVHDLEGRSTRLTENDILDGKEVVPGWSILVRELFT